MTSEPRGFLAVRVPDIQRCTQHVAAGVVHQVAAEVFLAEEDLDVASEREDARVGGDDSMAGHASATCFTLHAVLGQ